MKIILDTFIQEIYKRRKDYMFILVLILVGITFGSLFMTLLDKHDKLLVLNQINAYFDGIKNKDLLYITALKDNITSNLLFIFGIWLLGLSVIGMPIILFLVFFRGFIMGFSMATIVYKYNFVGILMSIIYIFPHHLFSIIILMILSYYSLNFSFNLISAVFKKKPTNFNHITNRYFRVLLLSIICTVCISLFEVFIVPFIMKFLLVFVK